MSENEKVPTYLFKNGEAKLFHLAPGEPWPEGWTDSPHKVEAADDTGGTAGPAPPETEPEEPAAEPVIENWQPTSEPIATADEAVVEVVPAEEIPTLEKAEPLPHIETDVNVLRQKLASHGVTVDNRWSARKLRQMIADAEKGE